MNWTHCCGRQLHHALCSYIHTVKKWSVTKYSICDVDFFATEEFKLHNFVIYFLGAANSFDYAWKTCVGFALGRPFTGICQVHVCSLSVRAVSIELPL